MTVTENDTATERIAKIRSTFLGYEDHGIFTGILDLDYGGSGQGAGTLCLDYNDRDSGKHKESTDGAVHRWVIGCLRACGADRWEKVAGRTVIAICEDGWNGKVIGLKPLPTEKGDVFMFSEVSDG
jgi:hypothetical protein